MGDFSPTHNCYACVCRHLGTVCCCSLLCSILAEEDECERMCAYVLGREGERERERAERHPKIREGNGGICVEDRACSSSSRFLQCRGAISNSEYYYMLLSVHSLPLSGLAGPL